MLVSKAKEKKTSAICRHLKLYAPFTTALKQLPHSTTASVFYTLSFIKLVVPKASHPS